MEEKASEEYKLRATCENGGTAALLLKLIVFEMFYGTRYNYKGRKKEKKTL